MNTLRPFAWRNCVHWWTQLLWRKNNNGALLYVNKGVDVVFDLLMSDIVRVRVHYGECSTQSSTICCMWTSLCVCTPSHLHPPIPSTPTHPIYTHPSHLHPCTQTRIILLYSRSAVVPDCTIPPGVAVPRVDLVCKCTQCMLLLFC